MRDLKKELLGSLAHYKMTAVELAREAEVSQPVLCKLINGKQSRVRSDTLDKLEPWLAKTAVPKAVPKALRMKDRDTKRRGRKAA